MSFCASILRCTDGSHHTGHTEHLEVRIAQHATGTTCTFTKHRSPVVLA